MINVPNVTCEVLQAVESGASGYLLFNAALRELLDSVHALAAGKTLCSPEITGVVFIEFAKTSAELRRLRALTTATLTSRELEIVLLLDQGFGNREIAAQLQVGVQTVKNHVHSILEKLNVPGRREAAQYARESGLIVKSSA